MVRITAVLVSVGLVMVLALPAEASIVNGSFESGTSPPTSGGFRTLYASPDTSFDDITGWEVRANSIDWIDGYWNASNGSYSIDMSGTLHSPENPTDPQGSLVSIKFTTTKDVWYRVQLDMSGNPDSTRGVKTLNVSLNGSTPTVLTYDTSTAAKNNTRDDMKWETHSLWFQAGGTQSELQFASATPTQFGPALDNVRVDAVAGEGSSTIIPEPTALVVWSLLGIGVGGLALLRRVRRRSSP